MGEFESKLVVLEAELAQVQKTADALNAALRRLRTAARGGQVGEIERTLTLLGQQAKKADAAAQDLSGQWSFDAKSYLAGGYLDELREAANAAGLNLIERDGRLYAFPLMLRIDSREAAVRVGKKTERRIRPKELVKHLEAMQKRPQRFSEQQFLDKLYRAYVRIAGSDWQKLQTGPGPAIPLSVIHELLTLMLPSSEYPTEEFGRDLLLLARKPDLRSHGCSFGFPGSTLSKERLQRITVYDEHGGEHTYIALHFVKG